jgi:uncharacterized membrane protein YdjX (TVP38/TMEM64 family)
MNWIKYWELTLIGLIALSILVFWVGKYFLNSYYINKSKKEIDKTEKLFGVRAKAYVSSWRRYLAKQERENKL